MNKFKKIENCKNLITQLLRKNKDPNLALRNYEKWVYDQAIEGLTPKISTANKIENQTQ